MPFEQCAAETDNISPSGGLAGENALVVALPGNAAQEQQEGVVDPDAPILGRH